MIGYEFADGDIFTPFQRAKDLSVRNRNLVAGPKSSDWRALRNLPGTIMLIPSGNGTSFPERTINTRRAASLDAIISDSMPISAASSPTAGFAAI